MKKLVGVLSILVLSLILTGATFTAESVIDEAMAPETNTQSLEDQTGITETLASDSFLHSVWPFPRESEPFPGDSDTKVPSLIDDVVVDLSLDSEDKNFNPPMPDSE